ncbi:GNAT family N-acetyltransferase [uncultured Roseobacter sp.]|uniref:GNAT family N-acetyltransferase n=1 Tax=uncultured Roseobacter sp. TaxID=114847 RepID=UPI0026124D46|nr:GNAT family N-acetyltransferase [uncultured Roseobacter sp.]
MKRRLLRDDCGHCDLIIRRAVPDDAPHVAMVERSAAQPFSKIPSIWWLMQQSASTVEWASYLAKSDAALVAQNHSDGVVAFLGASVIDRYLHIDELSVKHGMQRRGIGRQLVDQCLERARSFGMVAITPTTYHDVPWNAPWYLRRGFCIVGEERMPGFLRDQLDSDHEQGLSPPVRAAMWQRISSNQARSVSEKCREQ